MKISIVIPVYNKGKYVEDCLCQLLLQQMDDFEVVVVDDGSSDQSGILCDQIAAIDPRVRVFHTPNGGVTAARCYGVQMAKGKYVMFVDSDDTLPPHAIQTLYAAIEQTQADEVIGTFSLLGGGQSPVVYTGFVAVEALIKAIITNKNHFPILWGAIFRRSILEDCLDTPRDIIEGEDKLMQVKVLMKHPKVYFIPDCVYQYTPDLPNNRRRTLEREQLYDRILRKVLAPEWPVYQSAFVLHQLKEYERFIEDKRYEVRKQYYEQAIGSLPATIPLYDKVIWFLPPRLAYPLIRLYRFLLKYL